MAFMARAWSRGVLRLTHMESKRACSSSTSLDDLNETIKEGNRTMNETIKEGNRTMKEGIKLLNEVHKSILDLKQEFKGFVRHTVITNEDEIVAAVYVHLSKTHTGLEPPFIRKKLCSLDSGKTICEIDGLIYLGDRKAAVIEVKGNVRRDSIDQLEKTAALLAQEKKLAGCSLFLGGGHFEVGVKELALRRGIHVVTVSGLRYKVESEGDLPIQSEGVCMRH